MIQRNIFKAFSENLILSRIYCYNRLQSTSVPNYNIQLYNPKTDLKDVLKVVRDAYLTDANISIAYNLNKPTARLEYEDFFTDVLNDGLTFVARDVPSKRIVGYCANKLQSCPQPGEPMYFEKCLEKYKDPNFRNYLAAKVTTDKEINLFEEYNCEHIFHIVNMTILPEFRDKKVAFSLIEHTTKMAKNMANGKYPETTDKKHQGKIPKIIFSIASSKYSERISIKFGFRIIKEIPFSQIIVDGAPISEKLPKEHTHTTLHVLKL